MLVPFRGCLLNSDPRSHVGYSSLHSIRVERSPAGRETRLSGSLDLPAH